MNDASFQLKGSAVSVIVLELYHYTAASFADQLGEKVRQAPQFFQKSPVVISLEKLEADQSPHLSQMLDILSLIHI